MLKRTNHKPDLETQKFLYLNATKKISRYFKYNRQRFDLFSFFFLIMIQRPPTV